MLASMASFYTEQQSLDVREGLARRVKNGLFVSKPPFGYVNVRRDGRSLIELHSENAAKVRRIFDLYAHEGHTLDSLAKALADEGVSSRHETIDLAIRAFELSQDLRAKWFAADVAAKRRILEIVCLNWTLDGVSLVPEMRKPFELVAEGLQKKDSRGNWTAIELFIAGVQGWEAGLRRRMDHGRSTPN